MFSLHGGTDATRSIGAVQSNPGPTVSLCDTGSLRAGAYLVGYLITASAACRVQIRHRNAADDGNIWALNVDVPADMSIPVNVPVKDPVNSAESFDCVTVSGPGVGEDVQAGVWVVNIG